MSVRQDSGLGPESVSPGAERNAVGNAVDAARRYLLSIQAPDGHWCGELEGDTILESEYVLTLHFLGRAGEIWAKKPFCAVPESAAIGELHVPRAKTAPAARSRMERVWRAFFTEIDRTLKRLEAGGVTPLRKRALAACETWIHERLALSDGLGAIFPPIINTILAVRCRGYAADDPRVLPRTGAPTPLASGGEHTLA